MKEHATTTPKMDPPGRGSAVARARRVGGRRVTGLLTIGLSFVLMLVCFAGPASAARVHLLESSSSLPEEAPPFGIAVDQTTEHFYVGTSYAVYNFDPDGELDPLLPVLPGSATLEPLFVTVDNSGGAHDGYVYASGLSGAVQQYNPSGSETAVKITRAAIPPNGTAQGGGLPPVVNSAEFRPRSVEVGPSGNVFVSDQESQTIDEFTPAGAFVAQLLQGDGFSVHGMAIDAGGNIYITASSRTLGLPVALYKFNSSGECVSAGCSPLAAEWPDVSDGAEGVAVDRSTGRIFVSGKSQEERGKFSELDSSGALLGATSLAGATQNYIPAGIGIDESSGNIFVAARATVEPVVQMYGPVEVVPDVKALPAEGIGEDAATLKGEIAAAEVAGATCAFQYVRAEEFAEHRFEGAAEAPCEPEGPFSGEAMNPVEAKVEGLQGGTTYSYRLVGTNANGSNPSEVESFLTLGPTVGSSEALEITGNAATLKGAVDPNGSSTNYHFEYLSQAKFEEQGGSWTGATEIPPGGIAIGGSSDEIPVSQRIEGLSFGTAYRFRIVAVSGEGATQGEEIPFTTYAVPDAALPDGRRYEQASPVEKNGTNVQGDVNFVQTSPEGDAVTFFTNTGIPGGEGAQQFPTYLASRAPDGSAWSTQGLLPPASYGPEAAVVGWTEDLSDTYDFSSGPSEAGRLLRRSNSDRSLTQLGTVSTTKNPFVFAAASHGGSVALLESGEGGLLPDDLPGRNNLYAYDRQTGALVVAGVLNPGSPGGQPTVPPGGAKAGAYGWFGSTGGSVNLDNSYYTQVEGVISIDGRRVFFTAGDTGQLYVRENPLAPQSAMSGERCTESGKACTVRISSPEEGVSDPGTPAAFVRASLDGSVVYFLDQGRLTADATGGSGYDLYRYDLADGSITDMTLDSTDKRGAQVEGVLGVSADGGILYFVAAGKLSAEASQALPGETNLYVLDGSEIHLIARLGTDEEETLNWTPSGLLGLGERSTNTARTAADGNALLFRSKRRLTAYRNAGVAELYLYRSGSDVSCISCNPSGEAPGGPAGVEEIPSVGVKLSRSSKVLTRNLSANGRRVVFDSADRLVSADENSVNDVYEWEEPGEGSCSSASGAYVTQSGGCLFLISGGARAAGPSWFGDTDEGGGNVFFFTAQSLVAQDKDELVDIYDARVDGGIPAQEALPATPCREEADCLPQAEGEPATSSPQSPAAAGANVKSPGGCKAGFARRHGKCVRRHTKHHRKHRRHHGHKHQGKAKHHGNGKQRNGSATKGGGR